VNDGGRNDGDRDGKEEGEGRHQKRAEPEAREEREGGDEERYPGDDGVLHGASYLERRVPRRRVADRASRTQRGCTEGESAGNGERSVAVGSG